MKKLNLLEETLEKLAEHGKTPKDVHYVISGRYRTDMDTFMKLADVDYVNGIDEDPFEDNLVIMGEYWWLERSANDVSGTTFWIFIKEPSYSHNAYPEMTTLFNPTDGEKKWKESIEFHDKYELEKEQKKKKGKSKKKKKREKELKELEKYKNELMNR